MVIVVAYQIGSKLIVTACEDFKLVAVEALVSKHFWGTVGYTGLDDCCRFFTITVGEAMCMTLRARSPNSSV